MRWDHRVYFQVETRARQCTQFIPCGAPCLFSGTAFPCGPSSTKAVGFGDIRGNVHHRGRRFVLSDFVCVFARYLLFILLSDMQVLHCSPHNLQVMATAPAGVGTGGRREVEVAEAAVEVAGSKRRDAGITFALDNVCRSAPGE